MVLFYTEFNRLTSHPFGEGIEQAKVVESEAKGHTTRLGQRQKTLAVLEKGLEEAEHIYGVNITGLSLPYRRLLKELVEGLGAMDLRDQGKPIRVYLKDMPP